MLRCCARALNLHISNWSTGLGRCTHDDKGAQASGQGSTSAGAREGGAGAPDARPPGVLMQFKGKRRRRVAEFPPLVRTS